jgi:tetratricopeptide (TPR) repeat protein
MESYKKIHRLAALFTFLASLAMYLRTLADTVSFWDCGEFIACSYTLGIPHPPGAPFYLLLGRLFSLLPLSGDIAVRVNIVSSISSALTIMLTYLIIVLLIKQWRGEPKSTEDVFVLTVSGVLGALSFAFTDTFWFNGVEAEVYAISMLFTAAIVWLILVWLEKSDDAYSDRYLLIIAYLVGLAIGVHLLMILALPAIGLIVYYRMLEKQGQKITVANLLVYGVIVGVIFAAIYPGVVKYVPQLAAKATLWSLLILFLVVLAAIYWAVTNEKRYLSLAFMSLMLVLVGYSTYAMIYIRSGLNPEIDENDPENTVQMEKYLNREQYGDWGLMPRRFPGLPMEWQFKQEYPGRSYQTYNLDKQMSFLWDYQIKKMYLRYLAWQFIGKGDTIGPDGFIVENFSTKGLYALPFLIGLIGMIYHFYKHSRHAFSFLTFFILTGVAIVIYLNQEDPQPRERDYVFIGSFFAFALWIGIGVSAIFDKLQEAFSANTQRLRILGIVTTLALVLILPINLIAHNFHEHDRSGNKVAYDYSYNILQSCEPNSILFTNGDNDTFPLWYLQFVEGIRKDVRVVNLSLLNTPWYIKQLKYQEPKVPISLKDEEIDQLELIPWEKRTVRIPVRKDIRDFALKEIGLGDEAVLVDGKAPEEVVLEVAPTLFDRAIRVQDFMILNIIYANNWKKPVNFAVTVSDDNKVNSDDYLRMDGLTFKLIPIKGQHVAKDRLQHNLFDIFKFRNLDDPYVYYDDNVIGLLQNYRAAFLRLTQTYLRDQQNDKALATLDRMEKVLPEKVIPVPDYRLTVQVGQLYEMAGRKGELSKRLIRVHEQEPDNGLVTSYLVTLLSRDGKHGQAAEILEKWVAKHPEDLEAKTRLDQERKDAAKP